MTSVITKFAHVYQVSKDIYGTDYFTVEKNLRTVDY